MSGNNNSGMSWTVVIVMMILFWPIGLVLLVMKLSSTAKTSPIIQEKMQNVGFIPKPVVPVPDKVVECSGCGAKNTVRQGWACFCEYCGNKLA